MPVFKGKWTFLSTFKKLLLEYNCFIMLFEFLLYSKVNRLHVYILSPLFWISFPFKSPQSTEQSSLCYAVRFSFLICFIHSRVYICMSIPISQSSQLSPPLLVSICLFSTSGSLFLLCKQVHLYLFSRFHIYVLIYNILFMYEPISQRGSTLLNK